MSGDDGILAVRLDSAGDVLCAGPAVRAAAASGRRVTMLTGPLGAEAARLLPGAAEVLEWPCPWILASAPPVRAADVEWIVDQIRRRRIAEALILTSFHQSPLPTALVLRLAGVGRISAISPDYPGSLLDLRVPDPGDVPEPARMLRVAQAAGFGLPAGDDGWLRIVAAPSLAALPIDPQLTQDPYVVLHPGASAPARAWSAARCAEAVDALSDAGWRVLVTGSADERALTALVAGRRGADLGGRLTLAQLGAVLGGARAVIVGNTGPAHLAAAVGAPVVSLFSPVVPAARWAPHTPARRVLGDQHAPCRATRAVQCPVPGHPCLESVAAADVVEAVAQLTAAIAPAPDRAGARR